MMRGGNKIVVFWQQSNIYAPKCIYSTGNILKGVLILIVQNTIFRIFCSFLSPGTSKIEMALQRQLADALAGVEGASAVPGEQGTSTEGPGATRVAA